MVCVVITHIEALSFPQLSSSRFSLLFISDLSFRWIDQNCNSGTEHLKSDAKEKCRKDTKKRRSQEYLLKCFLHVLLTWRGKEQDGILYTISSELSTHRHTERHTHRGNRACKALHAKLALKSFTYNLTATERRAQHPAHRLLRTRSAGEELGHSNTLPSGSPPQQVAYSNPSEKRGKKGPFHRKKEISGSRGRKPRQDNTQEIFHPSQRSTPR